MFGNAQVGDKLFVETLFPGLGPTLICEVAVILTTDRMIHTSDGSCWFRGTGGYCRPSARAVQPARLVPITEETKARFASGMQAMETSNLIIKIEAWMRGDSHGSGGGLVDSPHLVAPVLAKLEAAWEVIQKGKVPE